MGIFSKRRGKGPDDSSRRDFSHVTSVEQALAAVTTGELEPIHLLPPEFGGADDAVNVVYVPLGVGAVKQQMTETLRRLVQDGTIDKLTVSAEYKGSSFVPAQLVFNAYHSTKSGSFSPTIDIW